MWKVYEVCTDFNITGFYSAFVRSCPGEYFFQGESHDFWEMVYVLKGSACVCADDKVIALGKNQLIFHKPMEFHSLRTSSNEPTELLIISFSCEGEFINKFQSSVYSLDIRQTQTILEISDFIRSYDEYNGNLHIPTDYLENLKQYPLEFKFFKNLTENFLIMLSRSGEANMLHVRNMETQIYTHALRTIDRNIYNKITVAVLAKECNASVSYLKKIFSKYNGLGIHEYILNTKFTMAKQLLEQGESVTDISEKLGFSSQNYFSTAFKRVTGSSPSKFKQRN